ncbi:recombinase family protein [Mycobacterium terramassiliense]|uniref:Integrase n=1 Tax=Mycobacterium terramassiliense TaxID=1841859 RepID=A0A2U3NKI4_9MYCO|nr:recombinase family protein [Mycobacterium terramassiliense]SPM32049.1 integrase [Mycobacterium terramassiliense]
MGNYLGRVRLSVSSDESTSVERQREHIKAWAKLHGHTIIGWAEDVDVSGKVSPFDAPNFGDWLQNRWPEFDGIVAWKLDRLARNTFGLNDLFRWAHEHDKTVVSITESIDLSTPIGRAIAGFLAALAEMELENIRARVTDSHRHLRSAGRFAGGTVPYGFRVAKNGNGCTLDADTATADVVRRAVAEVLDGTPLAHICRQFEAEQIPAPRGGQRWSQSALRSILRSRTLLGEFRRGNLGPDGKAIKVGAELIDLPTFQRVQAVLDGNRGVGVRRDASALSGLVKCGDCGESLWFDTKRNGQGKVYYYYRPNKKCEHSVSMQAEFLEQLAEAVLLAEYGDTELTQRQWVAGEDNATALADAVRRATALAERLGVVTSPTMQRVLGRQLDAVTQEIETLEAMPQVDGHWEQVGTGETWGHAWQRADKDERRNMLRNAGIEFHVTGGPDGARTVVIPARP